jgi:hypothetical protein
VVLDDGTTMVTYDASALHVVIRKRQEKEAIARYAAMAKMSIAEMEQWLKRRRVKSLIDVRCTCLLHFTSGRR